MADWLDPKQWNQIPFEDEMRGTFSIVFLVVFALGFVIATWLAVRPPARIRQHALHRRVVPRFANLFMWAFGAGLAFFAFRLMGLPFLGWRIWAWITILAVLVVAGYTLYFFWADYPRLRAEHEARQLKRYYQQERRRRPLDAGGAPLPRSDRAAKRRQRSGRPATRDR